MTLAQRFIDATTLDTIRISILGESKAVTAPAAKWIELREAALEAADGLDAMRKVIQFAIVKFCDPYSLDNDPAAAKLLEMASELGINLPPQE